MSQHTYSESLSGSYGFTDTLKRVYYGPGSTRVALPKLLDTLGIKTALVVTGRSLYHKTDLIGDIVEVLKACNAFATTFYEIGQHSPIAEIQRGTELFKKYHCDGLVSVGGGSPIDAAKAIAYHLEKERGGPAPPHIAIPTTLSAAEYSIGAGYTDNEGNKVAVSSQSLAPAGIILDAEMTLTTPERLWLSTGIRALDHAIESLYRPLVPVPVKVLCYSAMADLFTYLPLSKSHPNAVDIRQKLQLASWMSLWPLKLEKYSALGLSHALGHKLGARYGIPHGITSCITLAPTVALKAEIATHEDKEHLSKALIHLQQPSTGSIDGDVILLSSLVQRLVNELGLTSSLAEYGVPREDLPDIAARALGSREDPGLQKVVKLLENVYN